MSKITPKVSLKLDSNVSIEINGLLSSGSLAQNSNENIKYKVIEILKKYRSKYKTVRIIDGCISIITDGGTEYTYRLKKNNPIETQ